MLNPARFRYAKEVSRPLQMKKQIAAVSPVSEREGNSHIKKVPISGTPILLGAARPWNLLQRFLCGRSRCW